MKEVQETKANELNQVVDDLDQKTKKIAQISEERRRTLSQAGRLEEKRQRDQVLDQLHTQFMEQERKRHEESKRKLKAQYEELDDEDEEGS